MFINCVILTVVFSVYSFYVHSRPFSLSGNSCVNKWGSMTRFVHLVFIDTGYWDSHLSVHHVFESTSGV